MARPISRLTLAVAALAWALLAARGSAQMGYQASSLEWLIADSDVVVRASVAAVERTPIPNPEPKFYRNPESWKVVTLKVHETIKGDRVESLTFTEWTMSDDRIYEGWKAAGREQLWFLARKGREPGGGEEPKEIAARSRLTPYGGGWSVIRLGPPVPEEKPFTQMPPPIFTMGLDVLRDPDLILLAARASALEGVGAKRVEGHSIELPRGVMHAPARAATPIPWASRLTAAWRSWPAA